MMEQIGQNEIMARVCKELSNVCKMLAKQEIEKEKEIRKIKKKKLKIVKKHKLDKIVKCVEENNKDYVNKMAESFENKAKVFKEFAKLHKEKEKEVKKEWQKINNQK